MMSLKSLFKFLLLLACIVAVSFAKKKDEDAEAALRDLHMGMAGLKEASNNPAVLAQLMRDLQDPEMMAEAKKMMENPEFQNQMKKLSQSKEFKESVKSSINMMKDPSKQAEAEAKLEHMIKVGNKELKEGARNVMEDAMAAMGNPEVMAEMQKMVKDPSFQRQLAEMAKDPSFQNYVEAMKDMMNDPKKKKKMQALGEAMRA